MSVGMVIMRPTSIVVAGAGSSASIRAAGGVEFASATSLSLNGVFTSDYDDYMIVVRWTGSAANDEFWVRLRSNGSDNSTASSYVYQELQASGSTVSGARTTNNQGRITNTDSSQRCGASIYLYGAFLSQPTAWRSVGISTLSNAITSDFAGTHNQSTAYDGITLYPDTGNITGQLTVFGLAQ